jgi:stage II sporulation protein AA (anti-sigma F factor antagonist)
MTLLAKVSEETHGDVVIAVVEGEIDASNTVGLRNRLRSALTNRATALVVDLAAVRYLDSAGINLLFEVAADLGERQQQLHMVVPPTSPILRAIAITGLDRTVPTHADRAAALAAAAR